MLSASYNKQDVLKININNIQKYLLYASYRIVQRQDNIAMPLIHKNIKALIFYLDRIKLTAECALRLVAVGVEPVLNELPELL